MIKKVFNHIGPVFTALLLFVPLSLILGYFTNLPILTFICSAIAIVPMAAIIGYATEELVMQLNPTWGGFINATFGNVIELVIAIFALQKGLINLVQASIVGSILGNILLLGGLSIFVGGLKFKEQSFNKVSARVSSTMLILAVAGLTLPTIYYFTLNPTAGDIQLVSDVVAIVLAITYIAGLLFSLWTHKHLFDSSDAIKENDSPSISRSKAIILLFISTLIIALLSEILVRDVEFAAKAIGLTESFVGIVIIAIIGNIAEKYSAITFAIKNKIDVSLEIGASSAIQVALFVVPILVLVGQIVGTPFTLVFSLFEIICMVFAALIVNYVVADGKCNWLEGVQLLAVYLIIAVIFFFVN